MNSIAFVGNPCNLKICSKLSKKYNFKIIEGVQCSILPSQVDEKHKLGSCKYSDLTVFSFHPLKPITTGEGGVVTGK